MRLTLIVLLAVAMVAQRREEQMSTEEIIARVQKNPGDVPLINMLAKRSDPRVIPFLRELFAEAKGSSARDVMGYPVSRDVAMALVTLGVKDDLYFDEVAGYVREAIAADPPPAYLSDAEGKMDSNKRNPAFERWCAARSLEFDACTRVSAMYILNIGYFGGMGDKRAVPLLREALEATDFTAVMTAASGLGLLNDKDSLPLIARACERFPPKQAELIVIAGVGNFNDPSVDALFETFIKDTQLREQARKEWQEKHRKKPEPQGAEQKLP